MTWVSIGSPNFSLVCNMILFVFVCVACFVFGANPVDHSRRKIYVLLWENGQPSFLHHPSSSSPPPPPPHLSLSLSVPYSTPAQFHPCPLRLLRRQSLLVSALRYHDSMLSLILSKSTYSLKAIAFTEITIPVCKTYRLPLPLNNYYSKGHSGPKPAFHL